MANRKEGGRPRLRVVSNELPELPFGDPADDAEANRRRRQNVAVLLKTTGELEHAVAEWEDHRRYGELLVRFPVEDGVLQYGDITSAVRVRHFPPKQDPPSEAAAARAA